MLPNLNNSLWFIKQKRLEESFEASHAPTICESKVNAVIRLLKQNGSVTAYDIIKHTDSTDPRTIARRLIRRGIIKATTYEPNATGTSKHARYWAMTETKKD